MDTQKVGRVKKVNDSLVAKYDGKGVESTEVFFFSPTVGWVMSGKLITSLCHDFPLYK